MLVVVTVTVAMTTSHFTDLARVVPQEILFVLGNPALDDYIFRILLIVSNVSKASSNTWEGKELTTSNSYSM